MKSTADKLASAGSPITENDLMLTILNGLGPGFRDIATFITGSKMEYDNTYALLLTHETRLEQEQNDKSMFNTNYAYYPKAFYVQSRGNFKRGGYTGGSFGNFGGRNYPFGRGNNNPQRLHTGSFRGGYSRGYSLGQINAFNSFQAPRNPSQVIRGGFISINGAQGSSGNGEEIICQICFKSGHTANICWHRVVEDYVATLRGFGKGKGPRAAYLSNFNGFIPHQGYEDYDNPSYMSPSFYPSSSANCYSGVDSYNPAAAFVANCEGTVDDGWYLDTGATHYLTNNMDNLHLRQEYKGTDQLIIGNGQGLPISHIGNVFLSYRALPYSSIQSTHTTIALKDMLLVPSITKNLLSISKLTSDNSLSVEFYGNICFVKDMKGQVLLQDFAEKGLYKLLLKPNSSSPTSHISHFQLNNVVLFKCVFSFSKL
ncbi:hypothetical protein AB3S75_044483 [Citrus x aurantiifolia]